MVILSGGTSKGAGDLTYRLVGRLGSPGIVVHGVALKPGKPLCLAACGGKPVAVLPGFPTSAMSHGDAVTAAPEGFDVVASVGRRGARRRSRRPCRSGSGRNSGAPSS